MVYARDAVDLPSPSELAMHHSNGIDIFDKFETEKRCTLEWNMIVEPK
jgi:hypothetical protein